MYDFAIAFPPLRRAGRLPLSRDQLMLLMAAVNEIFLGIDTYLAHRITGTLRPGEWIPIVFGPIAGFLLLFAGLIALRRRPAATLIATATLLASIAVGLLGAFFHLRNAVLPNAPAGQQITINLTVWAPPILAPLTFALVGILGISAAWIELPPDSGTLALPAGWRLRLPYSKTQAYLFLVSLGCLATVVSSVLDHARVNFQNPWLWLPTAAGVFATVVAAMLAGLRQRGRSDLLVYCAAMLLMILVGLVGAWLHVNDNLVRGSTVVVERFIFGAPFLAPLLFCNMGALGLIALLDPEEYSPSFRRRTAPVDNARP